MEIDLSDQVAVVTGGAQGIGFGVATVLLQSGAKVALWDQDIGLAETAAADLATHGQVTAVAVDIADYASVEAALATTEESLGPVAIVVNSAGIAGPVAPVAEYGIDDWRQVIDIDLNGTFFVNRAVVPGMVQRNYGRIVNIASIAGKEGNPNAAAYSAAKAGVIALTKSLGKELAGHDIAVNAISPATVNTRILEQVSQEFIDYMLSKIPRGRFLKVEEVAHMVAFLVAPQNSFTTGAVFDLSGGRATY